MSRARRASVVSPWYEHGYHYVLGSVPSALGRHVHYPVMIIP
jgi:nucleotide-binding universal stress UspA family protein